MLIISRLTFRWLRLVYGHSVQLSIRRCVVLNLTDRALVTDSAGYTLVCV